VDDEARARIAELEAKLEQAGQRIEQMRTLFWYDWLRDARPMGAAWDLLVEQMKAEVMGERDVGQALLRDALRDRDAARALLRDIAASYAADDMPESLLERLKEFSK